VTTPLSSRMTPATHAKFTDPVDYIQGIRYDIHDVRAGSGQTIVLEADRGFDRPAHRHVPITVPKPVAGPIARHLMLPHAPRSASMLRFVAVCERCDGFSKYYTRKNEPALFAWAARHRCGKKEES
jgi:hypothetical protein